MKSATVALTENQRKRLQQLLKDKQLPWQVLKRLEVIRLSDKGCTTAMIAQQLAIRKELVRKYCATFHEEGLDGLIHMEKPGKETLLTEEKFRVLEAYIRQSKKRYSLKELKQFLFEQYGIAISEEWLSKRLAMRKQRLKDAPWR